MSASAMSSASFQVMLARSSQFPCSHWTQLPNLFRDLHDDVAANDRLAAEPRMKRQPFRRVEAILFVLLHRRQVLLALAHDHVAGGAGAASAAVVLEMDALGERDIEQGTRPAMIGHGVLAVVDLDRDVQRQEGDLVGGHHFCSRISSARLEVTAPRTAASIIFSARRSVALLRSIVRSRMASRSVPHSTARSASMAWLIACSSSGVARWPPCASARLTWFITVSASVLVSMRSSALTSSSAKVKESSTICATCPSLKP